MSRLLKSFCLTSLATAVLASALPAQISASRVLTTKPASTTLQGSTASNPAVTLFGGLATGDGPFGMGPALAASFNWRVATMPVNFRLDPYFAYHSLDEGSGDGSIWFLGGSGNIELPFRTAGSSTEPYLFGGVGLYYSSVDPGDSGVDAGFGLGGGVRFGGFTLEAKMRDIDEFTTVSFLVGFMLGGR
jgi:hypothetical protein